MRRSIVLSAAGCLMVAVTARAQQPPTIPAGFTAYVVQGKTSTFRRSP
jgi:hypothetical protein